MFNVAIPVIKAEYSLLPSEASWIITAYIVVFALGSIIYGKLSDSHRIRSLITLGLVLFNLGSLLGAVTVNYPMLLAARVVQASGASAIPALSMIVSTRYLPSHLKGRAMGAVASTVAFSGGVGPILGGFIAGRFHWRYLFLLTLMTLLVLPYLVRMLPLHRPRGAGRFDRAGAAILAASISLVLLYVTQGILWAMGLGLLSLAWFIHHIRRAPYPFIEPSLLFNVRYRNTIMLTFITTGVVFGMFFLIPMMLSDLYGLGPESIGLVMFPGAMSAAIMGTLGGRLADSRGGRFVVYLGLAIYATSFIVLSSVAGMGPRVIAVVLVLSYVGFAFLQSSLPHTASSELAPEHTGIGMGIYTLVFFIAGAFSAAVIGKVLDMTEAGGCINPLVLSCGPRTWLYSNILLAMSAVLAAGAAMFRWTFRGSPDPS